MDDAEHQLGATGQQAEDGGVAAGQAPKGGQAVDQQGGTGEQEADVGHQAVPAICAGEKHLIKRKVAVTIRRLVQAPRAG
ncbi:hypothetical protein ACTJK0_05425 [Paenarthrobacter sp. 22069]